MIPLGLESMAPIHFIEVNPRGATHNLSNKVGPRGNIPAYRGYFGQNHSIPATKVLAPPVLSNSAVQFHMKMKQHYFN